MELIQWLSLFISILSLIFLIDLFIRKSDVKYYLIPAIIYITSALIFYGTRLLDAHIDIIHFIDDGFLFTTWSSVLRLQGILTVFIYVVVLGNYDRKIVNFMREKWKNLLYYLKR